MAENRMFKRYFTVEEANRLIPEVETSLRHIQALLEEAQDKLWKLREAKEQVRRRSEAADSNRFMQEEAELDFLKIVTQGAIKRVQELGAILQDVHVGLVDFPTRIGGDEVLLCWRLGEPEIKFYHNLTDGFVGRRELPPGENGSGDAPAGPETEG